MTLFVGIDLGTTNSSCSICLRDEGGRLAVKTLPIRQLVDVPGAPSSFDSRELLPSAVWLRDAQHAFTGQEVKDNGSHLLSHVGSRIVRSVKRRMGDTTWSVRVDGMSFNAAQISAILLKSIRESIEQAHAGETIEAVAIGIPASFSSTMRRDTLAAAAMAGFDPAIVTLVDEPVAALFAEATSVSEPFPRKSQDENVLVFDMGGGTLDVSILRIPAAGATIEILGTSRYNELAGNDFDLEIAALIVQAANHMPDFASFLEDPSRLTPEQRTLRGIALMEVAERAKRDLAGILETGPRRGAISEKIAHYRKAANTVEVDFSLDLHGQGFDLPPIRLGVADMLDCLRPLLELGAGGQDAAGRTIFTPICQALLSSRATLDNLDRLDRVLITGGSAYFPPVIDILYAYTQMKPQRLDPYFSVSRGAAAWAAIRSSGTFAIRERTHESLFLKRKGHPFLRIFEPDIIPSREQTTHFDDGDTPEVENPGELLRLDFFQGESASDPLMRLAHSETCRPSRALGPGARLSQTTTALDGNKVFRVQLHLEDAEGPVDLAVEFNGINAALPSAAPSSDDSIAGVVVNDPGSTEGVLP